MSKPTQILLPLDNEHYLESVKEAANRVVEIHRRLYDFLTIGQKLPEIDNFVASCLEDLKCKSAFRGYRYPGIRPVFPSYACLSVNDCIVHGTAAYYEQPLVEGDVLKVDIGIKYQGWIGDAARTFIMGKPEDGVEEFVANCKEALITGLSVVRPGSDILDWAHAVEIAVENGGYQIARGLTGHGYGRNIHTEPTIFNEGPSLQFPWHIDRDQSVFRPGMLLAFEPMTIQGKSPEVIIHENQWSMLTRDGSLSAHFEHDVLIQEDGIEILTAELDEIPIIIG